MPRNRILSDGIINFGKYKSSRLSGSDIMEKDPSYLLWCVTAEVASIDDNLDKRLSVWMTTHPDEVAATIKSATRTLREKRGEPEASPVHVTVEEVPESASNPSWGSW